MNTRTRIICCCAGDDSEVKQEKKDKLLAELQAKVAELQNPYGIP